MIHAMYSELDGPAGVTRRLEVKGHAGYAPAGQDIVCAGASILTQALIWMAAEMDQAECTASDGPEGPRVVITAHPGADPREDQRINGSFELAKTGLALLAERYPDNLRFADTSSRGEEGMIDLQLFAQKGKKARKGPSLSREQERQARAEGTLPSAKKRDKSKEEMPPAPPGKHWNRTPSPAGSPCWASARWDGSSCACTTSGPGKRPKCARATPSSP